MFLPFLRNFPHLVIMKCKPAILYEWSSIAHATVSIMLSYFVLILFSLQIIYQACSTRLPHCPCRGREYVMRFRLSVHPLSRSRPPTVLSLRAIAMFWPSHWRKKNLVEAVLVDKVLPLSLFFQKVRCFVPMGYHHTEESVRLVRFKIQWE